MLYSKILLNENGAKRIFEYHKEPYNEALHNSGFNQELEFLDLIETSTYEDNNSIHNNYRKSSTNNNNNHISNNVYKNKNRHRKIIWFNPPFCKLSDINKEKYFLNLINRHYQKNNPLSKIFNRNTLKISYLCTNNVKNNL